MQEGLGVPVRGRRAVHLRRDDRVGEVEILVARALVEAHHMVAEARAAPVEELSPGRERGEHAGDVVGRAPHEPVRRLGPEAVRAAPRAEVLGGARHEPHVAMTCPRHGIGVGQRGVGLDRAGALVDLGDVPDRLGESGVARDVFDPLAVEVHGAPIPQRGDVGGSRSHPPTLPQAPRHDKPRGRS